MTTYTIPSGYYWDQESGTVKGGGPETSPGPQTLGNPTGTFDTTRPPTPPPVPDPYIEGLRVLGKAGFKPGDARSIARRPRFMESYNHYTGAGLSPEEAANYAAYDTDEGGTEGGGGAGGTEAAMSPYEESLNLENLRERGATQRQRIASQGRITEANIAAQTAREGRGAGLEQQRAGDQAAMLRLQAQLGFNREQLAVNAAISREQMAQQASIEQARQQLAREQQLKSLAFDTWRSEMEFQTRQGAPGFVAPVAGRVG